MIKSSSYTSPSHFDAKSLACVHPNCNRLRMKELPNEPLGTLAGMPFPLIIFRSASELCQSNYIILYKGNSLTLPI